MLPIGELYGTRTYHLLREPGNSIDQTSDMATEPMPHNDQLERLGHK